jgi:hypothetical protein
VFSLSSSLWKPGEVSGSKIHEHVRGPSDHFPQEFLTLKLNQTQPPIASVLKGVSFTNEF